MYAAKYRNVSNEITGSSQAQSLRDENSYSVILGVFVDAAAHREVTLAIVLWTKPGERTPDRFYIVAPTALCIADDFTGFGADIQALKKRLRSEKRAKPPFDSFDEYAIQLRRELGIPHAQALELFYQTVSMKSVGNLTEFVRHHMLEPDDTDDRIRALIGNFENLNRAHDAVVRARSQIDALDPLVADGDRLQKLEADAAIKRRARDVLAAFIPERITFDSIEDLAACAGEIDAVRRFLKLAETLQTREPRMIRRLSEHPLAALASESLLPQLFDIAAHFQSHLRPNRFARELGIPGVDSKFIEENRTVLTEWLDCLLPAEAIDTTVRGLADHGFERRYGLRFEDPQIRFRWLDPSRAPGGISVATIPLPQLTAYSPACGHVIVTENKINFLTLPQRPDVLAIFGGGYAIDLLRALPWIANQPLHYWGDLDTHGFAILSRLRQYFPHTRSFLMDRDTLVMHRDLWTQELSGTRVLRDLPTLDPHDQALYDDLRNDRLGDRVRLEQERVKYQLVEQAVLALLC